MVLPDSSLNDRSRQQQQRKLSRGTIILWLVAVSWVFFLLPLYFVASVIREDVTRLEVDIQAVQENIAGVSTPNPEVQEIRDNLAQVQGAASRIEKAYSAIVASHTDWPPVMTAIGDYDPAYLTLTSLAQSDSRVTLSGWAADDSVVAAYLRTLEESDLFSHVVLQSLRTVATPFATPTGAVVATPGQTPTPTATITPTVTPTTTPEPSDEYETDDFTPGDIVLGQTQLHNFYPVYDVDKIKLLAKAGRWYRVFTSDLSPGVDTFLTMYVGGSTYTNNDHGPGDLSSEIMFQAPAGYDVDAIIKVTNRGQYGPDKQYQITVEEIAPTPIPTLTPAPTSTPTPVPTAVNMPTSTPDLRDVYEPDDTTPKPIAMGETQAHNFYPDSDTDKAKFLAKAGRYYRVFTSDLAPGVDTSLTVDLDGTMYTNDDRRPGDLSSEIVFRVETNYDVDAIVTVTNRGQYGADRQYQITAQEIIPTPTPTLTPLPTDTPHSHRRHRLPREFTA